MRRPSPRSCLAAAGAIFGLTIVVDLGWFVHYHQLLSAQVHLLAAVATIVAAMAGILGMFVEDVLRLIVQIQSGRFPGRRLPTDLETTTDELVARVVPLRRRRGA